jgi:hypothetical protein
VHGSVRGYVEVKDSAEVYGGIVQSHDKKILSCDDFEFFNMDGTPRPGPNRSESL